MVSLLLILILWLSCWQVSDLCKENFFLRSARSWSQCVHPSTLKTQFSIVHESPRENNAQCLLIVGLAEFLCHVFFLGGQRSQLLQRSLLRLLQAFFQMQTTDLPYFVLWTDYVPLKCINPQCGDVWRWGHWELSLDEVMRMVPS